MCVGIDKGGVMKETCSITSIKTTNCSDAITTLINGYLFVYGYASICDYLVEFFKTGLPFKFSSCRGNSIQKCMCDSANKTRYVDKDWNFKIEKKINAIDLLPSPLTEEIKKGLKYYGFDLDDPKFMTVLRKCDITISGALKIGGMSGWSAKCVKQEKAMEKEKDGVIKEK